MVEPNRDVPFSPGSQNRGALSPHVAWIGASPHPRAPIEPLTEVEILPGKGLAPDHHAKRGRSNRQVTLIQFEHLPEVAVALGLAEVRPDQVRRNLVISGIDLLSLKDKRFFIGTVLLEGTGTCPPCSRMDENLGPGGRKAMKGKGGITARVLEGGTVRRGDPVREIESA